MSKRQTVKSFRRIHRRRQAAGMYLQGSSQGTIAARLGVARTTIVADLKIIADEWRAEAVRDFELIRLRELQKIDLVERESWEAWKRSQQNTLAVTVTDESQGQETRKSSRNQVGDPRFLQRIQQCLAYRHSLLGLDVTPAPRASEKAGPPDTPRLSLAARRERVLALIDTLRRQEQSPKKPGLPSGDLFFTMKGRPHALEQTFPGVTAVLLLTDEQKAKLSEARQATLESAEIRKAAASVKSKPNATEAEKESVRKTLADARTRLDAAVAGVLTLDQKALIDRIQAVSQEAHEQSRDLLQQEFTAAKGDAQRMAEWQKKYREQVAQAFAQKLNAFLSLEQQTAMKEAAAAQQATEREPKKK